MNGASVHPPALADKDLSTMSREELLAYATYYRRRADSFRALLMQSLVTAGGLKLVLQSRPAAPGRARPAERARA
jgi:hypothetical protein